MEHPAMIESANEQVPRFRFHHRRLEFEFLGPRTSRCRTAMIRSDLRYQ